MTHQTLKRIKLARGFVESPTGGFVRSPLWHGERQTHLRRLRDEYSQRLDDIKIQLGESAPTTNVPYSYKMPVVLSWPRRLGLWLRVALCLVRYGTIESVQELLIRG